MIEGADHGLSDPRLQQAYTTVLVHWLSEMLIGARGHWKADGDARPAASVQEARKPAR